MSEIMSVTAETTTNSSAEPNTNIEAATTVGMDMVVDANQNTAADDMNIEAGDSQSQLENDAAIDNSVPVEEVSTDSLTGDISIDGELGNVMPAGDMGIMPVEGDIGFMPIEGDMGIGNGEMYEEVMADGAKVKDPIMSSWFFVIGVSVGVLALSVFVGVLLARRKIKKGIELYED